MKMVTHALLILLGIIGLANSEIINHTTIKNLVVPRGNYTQVRMAGYGYGDETLENDISKVDMNIHVAVDMEKTLDERHRQVTFDLIIFDSTSDYLCYVEAVHLLYHQHVTKECNFRLRTGDSEFLHMINEHNITDHQFLDSKHRSNEYFYVIDNTEYPEALDDP